MVTQALWVPLGFDFSSDGPAYKIWTGDQGIYRLTGAYLDTGGVNLNGVNIHQVRLYNLGQEVAIAVHDDDGDSAFDPEDYIEFYGQAIASTYAKYTKHNVYWLTLQGGVGSPLRMAAVNGSPGGGDDAFTHEFTLHYELDQGYWQEAPGPDSLDRWFDFKVARGDGAGGADAGKPVTFDLPLINVGGDGLGTLKLPLYGG